MTTKEKVNPKAAVKTPKNIVVQPNILEDTRIVAIGASAGGLEALKEFFNNVPPDCLHSFVIIQHLSPDYKSLMAELLSKNTTLPIYQIKNGMKVQSGCVYLIPPKKNMTIINGKLMLTNKPLGHDLNLPIDIFFRSLAQDCKEKAICIILSGTGSDGTSGSRAIKEAGGMIMVQDPAQSKFDGMPKSAINTGLVDYVLPVEQLPAELIHFVDHPRIIGASEDQIGEDEETVNRILHQIRNVTKHDFMHYKRPTLVRRIARRIHVNKFHNLKEYLDFLFENSNEVIILAREFLIGVTKFFRDTHVWEKLETTIIPDIVKSKNDDDLLKVWCVGSSTGEEAYSMAILISEEVEKQGKNLEVKVFATDLASNHLEIGSRGVYSESIIADVSKKRLGKYFLKVRDEYQVVDSLRRMVIFSQHNVLRDPPFNKMDLSVCRNLLIYMQPQAQKKIIGRLHYSLNMNGILLLGSSETLGDHKTVMQEIDRKAKLFQNIKPAKTIGMEPLNYPDLQKLPPTAPAPSTARVESKLAEVMNEVVAEELGLASVYLDENFNILHAVGEFRKFIELPDKGFSTNLLKMLPNNLSVTISTAVRKAAKGNKRVLYKGLKIRKETETLVFDLLVTPFAISSAVNSAGCLLLFMPKADHKGTAKVEQEFTGIKNQRIIELEEELKEARESLQMVIEEIETSNEELQATNEELLAANEELQSTNEELQSVNEELHTVNAELQQKIEDLAGLNADMDNLLKSTDIGTIFLDKEMRIRKFTPAIREHFNLRDSDIDRPIEHFTNSFGSDTKMFEKAEEVMKTKKIWQQELLSRNGNWYLQRITPYQDSDDEIHGAVISFVDINRLKISEELTRKSGEEFKALYNNAPDMFASFDLKGYVTNCNVRLVDNLGYKNKDEIVGLHLSDLYIPEDVALTEKRHKEFTATGKLINVERNLKRKDGTTIVVSVNAEVLRDKNGEPVYSICSLRDITNIKEVQKQYLDKNKAFEQLLEGTMAGYWDWMVQDGTEYLSPSFKHMFGYADDEMESSPEAWQKIIHPDDLASVFENFDKHVASKGAVPYDNQVRYYHRDGSIVWVYCKGKVIEWDAYNKPIRMVGSHVDITALKHIELELYRSNRELEQFAYVASHDLQEPLNTITDFVGLFEQEYKDKLSGEANQYLEFINQATNRMRSLVKSVLGYSRIGKANQITSLDCNVMVKEVVDDLSKKIKDTKTVVEVGKLPTLNGHKMEMSSLFLNLISNAIKFRKEKGKAKVVISAKREKHHWLFSISDNGIGIEKKNQDRIFNIFQRLNNMDRYEGTGIGLAQCKKIVELHGGSIWVDSKIGQGSTFNFTIKNFTNEN